MRLIESKLAQYYMDELRMLCSQVELIVNERLEHGDPDELIRSIVSVADQLNMQIMEIDEDNSHLSAATVLK